MVETAYSRIRLGVYHKRERHRESSHSHTTHPLQIPPIGLNQPILPHQQAPEYVWLTSASVIVCTGVKLIFVLHVGSTSGNVRSQGIWGTPNKLSRKPLMNNPAPLCNPLEPRPPLPETLRCCLIVSICCQISPSLQTLVFIRED